MLQWKASPADRNILTRRRIHAPLLCPFTDIAGPLRRLSPPPANDRKSTAFSPHDYVTPIAASKRAHGLSAIVDTRSDA